MPKSLGSSQTCEKNYFRNDIVSEKMQVGMVRFDPPPPTLRGRPGHRPGDTTQVKAYFHERDSYYMSRLWAKSPSTLVSPAGSSVSSPKNALATLSSFDLLMNCLTEICRQFFFRSMPADISNSFANVLEMCSSLRCISLIRRFR